MPVVISRVRHQNTWLFNGPNKHAVCHPTPKRIFASILFHQKSWPSVFTKKNVEVWHSMLRSNISLSDPTHLITQRAMVVSDTAHESSFQHHCADRANCRHSARVDYENLCKDEKGTFWEREGRAIVIL